LFLLLVIRTPDQQATFLAATKASRWNPLWTLALATGLRRGELCGLRWQDVDLAKGVVRVERSCVQIGKDVVTNDSTKNGTVRRVSIDKATAAALRDLRKQQAAERLAVATGWGDEEDLVFVWPDGTRVLPDFLTKRIVDEQAGLALPQLRLHDLRHTHATTLLRAGMPVHIVSKRLGHKNVTLTLNTYADVIPDDDTTASDMYASLLATRGAQA
jgi:integrase